MPLSAKHVIACTALAMAAVGCGGQSKEASVLRLPDVAAPGSAEPNLAAGSDGAVVLSWLETSDEAATLKFATYGSAGWSDATTVASGENWFVNWADFPSVVPIAADLLAAHWLVRSGDSAYAYDVAVSMSRDAGATWSQPITPHRDGTQTEHGFVSLFPHDGGVGTLWLDGRNMAGHEHAAASDGGMTLRAATISREGGLTNEAIVDDLVCDCCQTDVALADGKPVAVYRDRTSDEVRDIHTASLIGGKWALNGTVAKDGWQIAGCPVNGPAIATSQSQIAVAWFTAADERPTIRLAFSDDRAKSFKTPIDIDAGSVLGRVGIALTGDGSALVSWLREAPSGEAEIRLRRVRPDGSHSETLVVGTTSAGRLSGFPQLAQTGDDVIVAWTDLGGDSAQIRTARVFDLNID